MERDAGHRGDAHLSVGTRVAGEGAGWWNGEMRCAPACTDHRPSPRGELGQVVVIDLVAPSAQDLGPGPEPVEEQLLVALGALLEVAGAPPPPVLPPPPGAGGAAGERGGGGAPPARFPRPRRSRWRDAWSAVRPDYAVCLVAPPGCLCRRRVPVSPGPAGRRGLIDPPPSASRPCYGASHEAHPA